MVKRLRAALQKPFKSPSNVGEKLQRSPPTFEFYLKNIKECKNLLEAKRIRHILAAEIRKRRVQLGT